MACIAEGEGRQGSSTTALALVLSIGLSLTTDDDDVLLSVVTESRLDRMGRGRSNVIYRMLV